MSKSRGKRDLQLRSRIQELAQEISGLSALLDCDDQDAKTQYVINTTKRWIQQLEFIADDLVNPPTVSE